MGKIITMWVVCLFISFGWALSLESRNTAKAEAVEVRYDYK